MLACALLDFERINIVLHVAFAEEDWMPYFDGPNEKHLSAFKIYVATLRYVREARVRLRQSLKSHERII
jgi:hypothetical protein